MIYSITRTDKRIQSIDSNKMSSIKLRDYQASALSHVIDNFKSGVNKQLLVLPTGAGKTIVMAAIAKHFNKRLLLLAHREELIQQGTSKLKTFWPRADIGICKGTRNDIDRQIVIGSVQTCSMPQRLQQLKQINFDILMIDEAHHAEASSYQSIIKDLGFDGHNKDKLLIGVTATPERADKKQLGYTFDKIVYSLSIGTLIKADYLAPVVGRKILTNFSVKGVRTRMGDFDIGQLTTAINTEARNSFVVAKYMEHAKERKAIAFCASIKHCHDLAEAFNNAGIKSAPVWGAMGLEERQKVLKRFNKGKLSVLTSMGVLTEGYDEPSIQCIIMARPTKSKSLFIQMVGRGLRKYPDKENCLVLDFTDQFHTLDGIMTLSKTIPESIELQEEMPTKSMILGNRQSHLGISPEIDKQFDLLCKSNYIWIDIGNNEWSLEDDNHNEIVIKQLGDTFAADLYITTGKIKPIINYALSLEHAMRLCEDYARQHLSLKFAEANAPWMNEMAPISPGQIMFLKKQGIVSGARTKSEASMLIRKTIALNRKRKRLATIESITDKQKAFLERRGITIGDMNKEQAIKAISHLVQTNK